MRFLLLNTDYQAFLDRMYDRTPGLDHASYDEQMSARNDTFFGVGDAYVRALRARGHDARDIHMNNARLQDAWAREHPTLQAPRRFRTPKIRMRRGIVPWPDFHSDHGRLLEVLAAQVAEFEPDVILNHDISWVTPEALRAIAGPDRLLVGQHAASPYPARDYTRYDLVVSSWPPTLERMRAAGVRAEHLALGFDPLVLEHLGPLPRDLPLTFVGTFSALHGDRTGFIEEVCRARPDMRVFAPSVDAVATSSPIHACYAGPAFGIDMFRVLARSQITLNHHGLPEPHANNMRLFEATGVGTLLLTDAKPDLPQYFEVGTEALTYSTPIDCLEVIENLSPAARDQIAASGQRRTLRAHSWDQRISELLNLL